MDPREYDWQLSDLARQDEYVPTPWSRVLLGMVQGATDLLNAPGHTMAPNPYRPGTEEHQFFEDARRSNTYKVAPELAMGVIASGSPFAQTGTIGMAGGKVKVPQRQPIGFAPGSAFEPAESATRIVKYDKNTPRVLEDPFHGFSSLRTGKTPDEMQWTFKGQRDVDRPLIRPEDIEGKEIIFSPGDRSVGGGGKVTSVGGTKLVTPQRLEAGAEYPFMHADKPVGEAQRIWANAKGQSTAMLNLGNEILQRGREPVVMFQTMGKSSLDSSKQLALPAIDLAKQASISKAGAEHINNWMAKEGFKDFPGWRSPKLAEWAKNTSGTARSQLIKAMDTVVARDAGFPDIGELRYALTNPQLRSTPTGSVGLTVSKLDPTLGMTEKSLHSTYPTAILGSEPATLGGSVPWHIGARDLHKALVKQGDPVRFAERPDYYSTRMPVGLPRTQVADPHWVDTVSEWIRKNPQMWALPTTTGPAVMSSLAALDQYGKPMGDIEAQDLPVGFANTKSEVREMYQRAIERQRREDERRTREYYRRM